MLAPRARPTIAGLLVFAGFLALVARALDFDAPPAASLSVARKFWRADARTRLLNSRLFQRDVELGVALINRDRAWPLAEPVILTVPPSLPLDEALEKLRKAAFVLAPRNVSFERGETGPNGFALRLAKREAAP